MLLCDARAAAGGVRACPLASKDRNDPELGAPTSVRYNKNSRAIVGIVSLKLKHISQKRYLIFMSYVDKMHSLVLGVFHDSTVEVRWNTEALRA